MYGSPLATMPEPALPSISASPIHRAFDSLDTAMTARTPQAEVFVRSAAVAAPVLAGIALGGAYDAAQGNGGHTGMLIGGGLMLGLTALMRWS